MVSASAAHGSVNASEGPLDLDAHAAIVTADVATRKCLFIVAVSDETAIAK
jgi:hypothetical protein